MCVRIVHLILSTGRRERTGICSSGKILETARI